MGMDRRSFPVKNVSGFVIPPFSLVQITGVEAGTDAMTVTRPGATPDPGMTCVTGSSQIAVGGRGTASVGPECTIQYDPGTGTPAVGDTWGPAANSFLLSHGGSGYRVISVDTSLHVVNAIVYPSAAGYVFDATNNTGSFTGVSAPTPSNFSGFFQTGFSPSIPQTVSVVQVPIQGGKLTEIAGTITATLRFSFGDVLHYGGAGGAGELAFILSAAIGSTTGGLKSRWHPVIRGQVISDPLIYYSSGGAFNYVASVAYRFTGDHGTADDTSTNREKVNPIGGGMGDAVWDYHFTTDEEWCGSASVNCQGNTIVNENLCWLIKGRYQFFGSLTGTINPSVDIWVGNGQTSISART